MLQTLSERLLGLAAQSVSGGIQACLGDLGRLARAGRVYVFMLSEDGQVLDHAFEWCDDGVAGHDFTGFKGVPVTAFPWSMSQFLRDEIVYVRDSSELPVDAAAERGACETLSIGAYVNLPLFLEGRLVGWLGFDADNPNPGWGDGELQLMQAAGRMLVFTIDRAKREEAFRTEQALSRRLAALGSFAAGLGHEINNPLAYVRLSLEIVRRRIDELGLRDEELRRNLEDCLQGIGRIADTVSTLRSFTQNTSPQRRAVNVGTELDSALKMLGPQLALRATVEREGDAQAWVLATPSEIGQVITNILQNAAEALPDGHAPEHRISIRSRIEDGWVELRISDSGPGFHNDVLPRIFDPFFTTRTDGGGSGIGLALCHNIVNQLGGTIEAFNDPAGGAVLLLRLPTTHPQGGTESQGTSTPTIQRRRILLVDDEDILCRVIGGLLRNHELVRVSSGRTAIALLSNDSDFDLILCDIRMPDGTGLEVYDYLSREHPPLTRRFVFMSGGGRQRELSGKALGDDVPVLGKPFTVDEFQAEVAKYPPLRDRTAKG